MIITSYKIFKKTKQKNSDSSSETIEQLKYRYFILEEILLTYLLIKVKMIIT